MHVQTSLAPAAAFLNRLVGLWSIRFSRQRRSGRFDVESLRPGGVSAAPPLRVVVNGAGPAGLINAATAYTAGAVVTVLEQRPARLTRSVWFDFTSSSHILRRWQIFSPAQDLLEAFGWDEQITSAKRSHQAGIMHVSCTDLQRFFSKVLLFLGVPIHYNATGLTACPATPDSAASNATAAVNCECAILVPLLHAQE